MSPRSARLILWLGLALMAPVPVASGVVTGLMPAARILMLGGICLLVVVLEHAKGVVLLFGAMLLAQALAYLLLLFVVAHLVSRLLARLTPRARACLAIALLAIGIALSAAFEVYRTPFRAASTRASLLEIFE
ncbi:MAG: hypothetical protein JSU66_15445 [Deltaproteobacteria bacterium]|nr:MAG: hypothetical protein JSU66_15445 [Deltaproteobacteria bacterium]